MRLFLLLLLVGLKVSAAPVILYDSGKTTSAKEFYPFEQPNTESLKVDYPVKSMDIFPVKTASLSLGLTVPKKPPIPIYIPICIIGDDATSKRYLQSSKEKLQKIGAMCYVVNVGSQKSFNDLQKIAPEIELIPANGNDFIKLLGLKHYPVLITNDIIK